MAQTVKNPPANAGDRGSIHGLGRSPEEGNGTPLQYSCLENPMDRGAWRVTMHGYPFFTQRPLVKILQRKVIGKTYSTYSLSDIIEERNVTLQKIYG